MNEDEAPLSIAVDRAECIGAGQCAIVAPRAFRLDDAMKAEVVDPEGEPEELIIEAAVLCPTQAIYVARGRKSLYP
jgi:ferredoxin